MIVNIPKEDQPGYEKTCAVFGISAGFFPQEHNPQMVSLLLPDDISKSTLFHLVRASECQNEFYRQLAKI